MLGGDRDRYDYITFGWIATIIGLLLFGGLGRAYTSDEHQSSYYAQRCAVKYGDSPFAETYALPPSQPSSIGEADPDWCDLAAQQSVAESTIGMHWAAWAGVVAGFAGFLFLWRTLAAAQEANRLLRSEQRAWLTPSEVRVEEAFAMKGIFNANVAVDVENSGASPAFDVKVRLHLTRMDFSIVTDGPFRKFVARCRAEYEPNGDPYGANRSFVVLPGAGKTTRMTQTVTETVSIIKTHVPSAFHLYCCVCYRTAGSNDLHHTALVYFVTRSAGFTAFMNGEQDHVVVGDEVAVTKQIGLNSIF